ncbi:MAG: ABC transporter ATP-binding protein [Spirochaetales bacterium]|nr:ABC transporter ATP-binding protein [Spirochaetales bacterium]
MAEKHKHSVKRFIPYYRPYKGLFFADLFCALLIAGIELSYPMFSRYILQTVIPGGNVGRLIFMLGLMLGLYILMAGLDWFVTFWGHVIGVRMEADMRHDLFSHMQKLPFKFYDNNRTGVLMSRVVNDLNDVAEVAHHGPEDIFLSLVMMAGSFVLLLRVEWHLAVVIFGVMVPLILWFSVSRRSTLSRTFRKLRERIGEINALLENSISGIRVARAFTNETYEKKKFDGSNNNFKGAKTDAYRAMADYHTCVHFFLTLLNVVGLAAGAWFIRLGWMDGADLLAFMLYINLVARPIRMFTNFTQQFERAMAGFNRFCEIMDEDPDIQDAPDARELTDVQGHISLEEVSFGYDDKTTILSDVNIQIEAGQTVALVGPTGAGKTTLCHLIPRFYEPQKGQVRVDGIPVEELTLESLRRNVGLVQQDVFLFTGTIRDNISYGRPGADNTAIEDAAKRAEIHDFILSLPDGYDSWIGEKGILLSGGQKQRLSIARAFLKNPPILLLDEATSALDNHTELRIQKALEELSLGRTSLVIAHRLSTVRHADKIVVLTAEGVKEEGTHEELYELDGLYRKLYDSQFSAETTGVL